MQIFDSLGSSLLSPMVLAFILGIIATLLKSDLKYPDGLYQSLTIYLLFAIGIKGGVKLSSVPLSEFITPILSAVGLCLIIPVIAYILLHYLGRFSVANAAAIAAHFGSVSAVTFSEGTAFLEYLNIEFEGFMPAMLAIMEIPAILISIFIAKKFGNEGLDTNQSKIFHELFTNKGTILLLGGLLIGILTGKKGFEQVAPLFDVPFRGILTVFLLEVGLVTGRRILDLKKVGPFLVIFGIVFPIFNAFLGINAGYFIGLSVGGATLLGLLCASASYIAAPAAMRVAIPEANPTYYLTASLAIAFPFNVTIGLPTYLTFAQYLFSN
jgi:hypothetical protein